MTALAQTNRVGNGGHHAVGSSSFKKPCRHPHLKKTRPTFYGTRNSRQLHATYLRQRRNLVAPQVYNERKVWGCGWRACRLATSVGLEFLYSDASWLSAGIYEIRGFRDGNSAPTFQGQFIAQEPSTLKNLDWSRAMLHLKGGQDLRLAIDEYPPAHPVAFEIRDALSIEICCRLCTVAEN